MSFNLSFAQSTNIDFDNAIPIFNVEQTESKDLASTGYLSSSSSSKNKVQPLVLWDVVVNYHDLNSHGILEKITGYASTEVSNLDGIDQIWKISTNGTLWERTDFRVVQTLSTVEVEDTSGTAKTTVEYHNPIDDLTYRLESFHKVRNTGTGELEWDVTEEISVKYNEWF